MRNRTHDVQREDVARRALQPNHQAAQSAPVSTGNDSALTGARGKMLAMQSTRGNQYVLRMLARGAFPGGTIQREEDSDEESAPDASNSMIGDAAGYVGDLLGVKQIPGKVKQVVDKTREGVNEGIDWTIDKVKGGAKKVEEWMED